MSAPERIWVNVYPDTYGGSVAHESETAAKVNCTARGTTHEYRLVKPKREPLYWVCRYGEQYVEGPEELCDERHLALRFRTKAAAQTYIDDVVVYDARPTPVYRKAKP